MKKLLALIISTLMILSLVACNNSDSIDNNDNTTSENQGDVNNDNENQSDVNNDNNENQGDVNDNNDQSNPSDDLKNKIDVSKITSSTAFSEGKAWVRYGKITSDEYTTLYCINKNGEILFTVDNTNISSPLPFHNGLSVVPFIIDEKVVYCICDENGNITKPSDIGATEFLIKSDYEEGNTHNLFEDGYIFAKKIEATFSGSSVTAALLDSSLEIIAGYTEEVLDLYEEYIHSYYYNGYLYNINDYKVFDVKAGKEIEDVSSFISSFKPKYASDMWEYNWESCVYYDSLASTFTVTLDLSEYSETISQMYLFENGKAPLVFESADIAFFTVINEDGSFCFDPVELSGNSGCTVKAYNDKYLVVSGGNGYMLETFDLNGKIAEAKIDVTGLVPSIKLHDDVIHISSTDMDCYYSLELEPLF